MHTCMHVGVPLICPSLLPSLRPIVRLYDLERRKSQQQRQELRSLAQGTGDRTDKIRTYNFPQVTTTAAVVVVAATHT